MTGRITHVRQVASQTFPVIHVKILRQGYERPQALASCVQIHEAVLPCRNTIIRASIVTNPLIRLFLFFESVRLESGVLLQISRIAYQIIPTRECKRVYENARERGRECALQPWHPAAKISPTQRPKSWHFQPQCRKKNRYKRNQKTLRRREPGNDNATVKNQHVPGRLPLRSPHLPRNSEPYQDRQQRGHSHMPFVNSHDNRAR